jgi:hypothetical protein
MPRRSHQAADWLASALEGARDRSNFPVRADRPGGTEVETNDVARHRPGTTLTPEERDRLATGEGPRAI